MTDAATLAVFRLYLRKLDPIDITQKCKRTTIDLSRRYYENPESGVRYFKGIFTYPHLTWISDRARQGALAILEGENPPIWWMMDNGYTDAA